MKKLPEELLELIKNGEKIDVEFKLATNKLPDSLFESIGAFLNRNGGHIFLGVNDKKEIIGVDIDAIDEMKRHFNNLCNNAQKISPPVQLKMQEYYYKGKIILYIYVYEGSDVHRCNGRIYDRNEDGDYDITNNTYLVSQMYLRKSKEPYENMVFPNVTIDDLSAEAIEEARSRAKAYSKNKHPWGKMNDMELIRSAGLYGKDPFTNAEGINLAGIMLFGKRETIMMAAPYYKTDAIYRYKNFDGYDDRDDVRENLIESYSRLVDFITKHIDGKFFIEDTVQVNPGYQIARELVTNTLIHRNFSSHVPARILISKEELIVENGNVPKKVQTLDINNFVPYPKNPKIAKVFKEMGLVDELGSGVRRISRYSHLFSNVDPVFKDGDVFVTIFKLVDKEEVKKPKLNFNTITGHKKVLLEFIGNRNGVTRKEINDYMYPLFDITDTKKLNAKVKWLLDSLKDTELIVNIGDNRHPFYVKNYHTSDEVAYIHY